MAQFLLDIKNATVYLGENKVLKDISWTIRPKQNWAVVGNNGSGKTTLLRLVFGELLPIEGGTVHWFNNRVWNGLLNIREQIGFVSADFQNNYDYNPTGHDVVISGLFSSVGLWTSVTEKQKKLAMEALDFLAITHLANKRYNALSYGEQRRVLLARALVNEPQLLVLDEPCAGLDIPTRESFLKTLSRLTKSNTRLIYVTHHIEELLPAISHVLFLKKGRVFKEGKKEDLLENKTISGALGCRIKLNKEDGRYWPRVQGNSGI